MYKENQEYCENVIAVSNRHLCKRPFLEQIKIVCEWHPKALILREKDLTEGCDTGEKSGQRNILSDRDFGSLGGRSG